MSGAEPRALVIGGGIIGTACAHYICQRGWRVTILDRGRFGKGCSHGNCGLVCPSHVMPLAEPGAISSTVKALFARNSPFSIRPRFDLALWSWLIRFARRCNRVDSLESAQAIHALLQSSRSLYDELFRSANIDCEWETQGLLFVFQNRPAMDHHSLTANLVRETFGVAARPIEGEALTALEPALKPGLPGGWHYPMDAHLRPDRLMASWRELLEAQGVPVLEHTEVIDWIRTADRAAAAITTRGAVSADVFIVATGAWTPQLNRQLGCKIPIQPGKGYSITMPRPARCPVMPLLLEEHHVAVTPMRSGYRLGSMMEFAGYDTSIDPKRLQMLRLGASHYLQEPYCDPVAEEWYGWRPMTPDGLPFLDQSPAMSNVWIAAGHNMLGLSMAPASGKLIAELISGEQPHINPRPYSIRRFGRWPFR